MERLGQVVVGTGVEAGHAVAHPLAGREQDHGYGVALRAELAQHLHSAHVGQHDVEENHVVGTGEGQVETVDTRVRHIGTVAALAQDLGDRLRQAGRVLNKQDAHRAPPFTADNLSIRLSP